MSRAALDTLVDKVLAYHPVKKRKNQKKNDLLSDGIITTDFGEGSKPSRKNKPKKKS